MLRRRTAESFLLSVPFEVACQFWDVACTSHTPVSLGIQRNTSWIALNVVLAALVLDRIALYVPAPRFDADAVRQARGTMTGNRLLALGRGTRLGFQISLKGTRPWIRDAGVRRCEFLLGCWA